MTKTGGRPSPVILLGVVVLLVLGCSGDKADKSDKGDKEARLTKDTDKPRPDERPKNQPEDISKAKPDFSLTSKEYAEEEKKDSKAAEAKYKNKLIELTGVVKDVGHSFGQSCLYLEGYEGDVIGVQCYTRDKEPWRTATPGQTVKLKGVRQEFAISGMLRECVVTDVSGPATQSLTAEELAKEYAADQAATSKKYKNKHLILSGEIDKIAFDEDKEASVTFKTASKPKVVCRFHSHNHAQTSSFRPGQKLKVLGPYSLRSSKDQVVLDYCVRVEGGK